MERFKAVFVMQIIYTVVVFRSRNVLSWMYVKFVHTPINILDLGSIFVVVCFSYFSLFSVVHSVRPSILIQPAV